MPKRTRTVEMLWNEPLEHNCSWLPPCSGIPLESRKYYQSIRPIHPFLDDTADMRVRGQYDWGPKLSKSFLQYQAAHASNTLKHVELQINSANYTVQFMNPTGLDLSRIAAEVLNGAVVISIPFLQSNAGPSTELGPVPTYIGIEPELPTAWYVKLWTRLRQFVKGV